MTQPSSEPESFVIALAQCESVTGTKDVDPRPINLARARRAVKDAASQGAQLVLFGEMFLTGYRTDAFLPRWALSLDGGDPTIAALGELAAEHGVQIMIGSATLSPSSPTGVHNTALLVDSSGLLGSYHKLHVGHLELPDGTDADEARWFSPGDEVVTWQTDLGLFGPQICYDSSFPELSRCQSLAGAEVLLNITASATGFEHVWEHYRFARAYENAAWYVNCSVVGVQHGDRFFGRSAVVDPNGVTVVEAKDGEEDLVLTRIVPHESTIWRDRMNPLRARRPEVYGPILVTAQDGDPR